MTGRPDGLKTWHLEAAAVALVLILVNVCLGAPAREWIAAAGVMGSFLHAQVSDRMAAAEAARVAPGGVVCHRWAGRYFALREVAWFAYFLSGRCWSALAGCLVFLAYPAWRTWWTRTKTRPSQGPDTGTTPGPSRPSGTSPSTPTT